VTTNVLAECCEKKCHNTQPVHLEPDRKRNPIEHKVEIYCKRQALVPKNKLIPFVFEGEILYNFPAPLGDLEL